MHEAGLEHASWALKNHALPVELHALSLPIAPTHIYSYKGTVERSTIKLTP